MQADNHSQQEGFSLAELLMGVLIFVTAALVLGNHVTVNYSSTKMQRDKVFAYTKAQAILSEIHSFVDSGNVSAAIDLDVLDDGVTSNPVLTISTDGNGAQLAADHPLSGNLSRNSQWVWSRRITVRPFSGLNNRTVRYITARIYKRDQAGVEHEMASLSSVVNSLGSAFPATQVFDVYLLAIENIPGWWVYMEAIIPFVESAITDLENRNPGLSLRTHWITKAGYGRNMAYRPYTNEAVDSLQFVPDVYFYPGKMPDGSASTFYYVPDLIDARINVDGVERHGYDLNLNPYPYALADFFNHTMRQPRAEAYHNLRVGEVKLREDDILAAEIAGIAPPAELEDMSDEPTWRLLLEDMNTDPDSYRHALLLNLHGELLPMPSLRNYSDAAKDPINLPFLRVVTHPEELRTARPPAPLEPPLPIGTDTTVRLRVYAYSNDTQWTNFDVVPDYPNAGKEGLMPDDRPIAVDVMDVNLTANPAPIGPTDLYPTIRVQAMPGGVQVSGSDDYTGFATMLPGPNGSQRMYYTVEFIDPGPNQQKLTRFLFYNTPVICPQIGTKGLYDNLRSRLYNLEYNPAPCQGDEFDPLAFDPSWDLASDGNGPKNTARWIITIPQIVFDDQRFVDQDSPPNYFDPNDTAQNDRTFTVRTRIWDPSPVDQFGNPAQPWETGTWPSGADNRIIQPDNFSETYTWWADSPNDVPMTERAQFQGDPRHNPYEDLLSGDPDFPEGYNWFHDSMNNNSQNARPDFPGIARRYNRWQNAMRQDVPRFFELLRTGLVNANAIWTTLTGYSYYYMGHGNEIGYDSANGYPSSIPVNLHPWGFGASSTGFRNNITSFRTYIRRSVNSNTYWWGKPWLGELYPDDAYDTDYFGDDGSGNVRGNLSAGNLPTTFWRYQDYSSNFFNVNKAWGTALFSAIQRTSSRGCVSMFNNGTSGSHFNHHFASGQFGNLVGSGIELSTNYGFEMPNSTEISRPFTVDTSGNVPVEFNSVPYTTNRFQASIIRTFYDHSGGRTGSGIVELLNPGATEAAYIIVNGLAQTTLTGTSFIAKYCLLSMFQSFFEVGDTGLAFRIKQPPRVEITSPTEITEVVNPTTVDILFQTSWQRWDGQPYTTSTPVGFAESEAEIEYVIMYSRDAGRTWLHVQDDSLAELGERPSNPVYLVADGGVGDETYTWATPAGSFPEGSYMVRIEAYRQNQSLHYSQHQTKIFIER